MQNTSKTALLILIRLFYQRISSTHNTQRLNLKAIFSTFNGCKKNDVQIWSMHIDSGWYSLIEKKQFCLYFALVKHI